MNPIALAVALAKKILEALQNAKVKAQASPENEFKMVTRHERLEERVENAFKADLNHLRDALGRWADVPGIREAVDIAEGWGRVCLAQNRAQLGAQRAALGEAEQKIAKAVPRLRAEAASWMAISGGLARVPELIKLLEHVPGWDGTASTGYGNQAAIQNRSSIKFSTSSASMPTALREVATLNKAVATLVGTSIANADRAMAFSNLGFPGSFSRTRAAGAALRGLGRELNDHLGLKSIQNRVDALEAEVNPVAEQLEQPWPI